jgi:hypothetical protein
MKQLTCVVLGTVSMSAVAFLGCGGKDLSNVGGDDGGDSVEAAATGDSATGMGVGDAGGGVPGADSGSDVADVALDAMPLDAWLSPVVTTGCQALCSAEEDAGCTGFGSVSQCLLGCGLLLGNPNCSAQASALFSCSQGASMSCDSSGNVAIQGCAVQQIEAESCALSNAVNTSLSGPCTQYCANVASAHCANESDSGCVPGCEVAGSLVPSCAPSWTGYVNCAETATITCGTDGKGGASDCLVQYVQFVACFAQGVSTLVGDGG